MTFCDTPAGIEVSFGQTETNGWTEPQMVGQTDVEVEIVIF